MDGALGEVEQPTRSFHLYRSQTDAFDRWWHEHKKVCAQPGHERGAIGGGDKWVFMPTGVGMCVKYICGCGDGIDLTEVDKW